MTDLSALQSASRDVLALRWKALFKREPPARVNTSLLCRVLAWHAQCEAIGHQPFALPASSSKPKSTAIKGTPHLSPGTRLLREWRGASYEVMVLARGYEYAGKTYTSLSSVARTITGTPWSGPAFFGLKG
jgi:hypothetical protein